MCSLSSVPSLYCKLTKNGLVLLVEIPFTKILIIFSQMIFFMMTYLPQNRQVCEAPALLHQRRAAGLRALLRGAPQAHIQQRYAQPATQLARAPGHQVQEAHHATHHLHGWEHQGD
jgi:hypothetical protein